MKGLRGLSGISLVVLGVLAVSSAAIAARATSTRFAQQAEIGSPIVRQMHENFARIGAIELAVISGHVEDVAAPARWLQANVTGQGLPAATGPALTQLRAAAGRAAGATDLASAGAAAADLLAACGSCHVAARAEVKLTTVPKPPDGSGTAAAMRQHNWATELMSLALVEPSDALWTEGTGSLASFRLPDTQSADDPSVARQIGELEARVKELATMAAQAHAWQERARIYGRLISTCGNCHNLNGVVLGPGIPMD